MRDAPHGHRKSEEKGWGKPQLSGEVEPPIRQIVLNMALTIAAAQIICLGVVIRLSGGVGPLRMLLAAALGAVGGGAVIVADILSGFSWHRQGPWIWYLDPLAFAVMIILLVLIPVGILLLV